MALIAGVFLLLFGGAMLWVLTRQFPNAKNTRIAYILTTTGGVFSIVWALSHVIAFGVVAVLFIFAGSIFGIVGWARKELRLSL